jgi:hypothetical protein
MMNNQEIVDALHEEYEEKRIEFNRLAEEGRDCSGRAKELITRQERLMGQMKSLVAEIERRTAQE